MKALEILKAYINNDDLFFELHSIGYMKEAIAEIEALLEPKSCETCKYYDGSHTCLNENSIAFETSNRVYGDDFCKDYDTRYKPKD